MKMFKFNPHVTRVNLKQLINAACLNASCIQCYQYFFHFNSHQ